MSSKHQKDAWNFLVEESQEAISLLCLLLTFVLPNKLENNSNFFEIASESLLILLALSFGKEDSSIS